MAKTVMLGIFLLFATTLSTTLVSGSLDLSVVSVTRTLSEDRQQLTLTAEFTASQEPQVEFRTYYKTLTGTVTEYANGRGRTSTTFKAPKNSVVLIEIGQFDVHTLKIYMDLKEEFYQQLSVTQSLNSLPATVTPGYDLAYTPGDELDVTAVVRRYPADDFRWIIFDDRDTNDVNARLTGYYVDEATGGVVTSLDFPSMGNFLHVNKTYANRVGATLTMSFTTAHGPVYGYFILYSFSSCQHSPDDTHFITDLEENVVLKVHDENTTGPFPTGYVYVSSKSIPKHCPPEKTSCRISCEGFDNDIGDFGVYKVEEDGTETDVTFRQLIITQTKYTVEFFSDRLNNSAGATANYVCKLTSREGTTATSEETLFVD